MEADPDIEIVQEDVKLPHLESLCLHLADHTRDTEDVSPVSTFCSTNPLTLSHFRTFTLGRACQERNCYRHRHACGRP